MVDLDSWVALVPNVWNIHSVWAPENYGLRTSSGPDIRVSLRASVEHLGSAISCKTGDGHVKSLAHHLHAKECPTRTTRESS